MTTELEEAHARALRFANRWDAALCAYERAANTLRHIGYTDEGGEQWKPPQGSKPFQLRAHEWAIECFGIKKAQHTPLRAARFMEEAVELGQAYRLTAQQILEIVEYVYNRPHGIPIQETGGVVVTLAVLSELEGIDMMRAGENELARVIDKIEEIRNRDINKTYFDISP